MSLLKCVEDPLELEGNWNTGTAKVVEVYFERCTERETCKNETEVREWMKDKYMFLVYNRRNFRVNEFGENAFEDSV